MDRNRRRDLTIGMRHKDCGLAFHAWISNRRQRRGSQREIREQLSDAMNAILPGTAYHGSTFDLAERDS